MAKPDAVNPVDAVDAVFENCKTADSRTPEALTSVLETLKVLKTDGSGSPLTQAARICADASREGTAFSGCCAASLSAYL